MIVTVPTDALAVTGQCDCALMFAATAAAMTVGVSPVVIAVSTNSSVGKLFIAGIIPGLTLATLLGTMAAIVAVRYRFKGRDFRLTDVSGVVVNEILA